jgi:hypothetical protein
MFRSSAVTAAMASEMINGNGSQGPGVIQDG